MRLLLSQRVEANRIILGNASSLIGTTVVTYGLGFFFWWLAARQFPPEAVGLASAAVSAMLLLGSVGALGLGTLLIGELARQPARAGSLITAALLTAGAAAGGLGIVFAIFAPHLSAELEPLAQGFESIVLFALGVALTAITLVLDQALIGLLRGGLQLSRNALFAAAKLIVLLIASIWFAEKLGLTIYAAWVIGNLVSLAALAWIVALKGVRIGGFRPQWRPVKGLGRAALGHHAFNMALEAPGNVLPVMATVLLSARMNAYFYTAWMIASSAFVGSAAFTTVLYAVGAADPSVLAPKFRLTLKLSSVTGLLASVVLLIGAGFVLGLFRTSYAEQAAWCLRILGLGVFPLIIKNHYVALCRIHGRVTSTALFMAAGGLLELVLAAMGARMGGLSGLSLGWLVAVCVEAAFMARTVYQAVLPAHAARGQPAGKVSLPHASGTPASLGGTDEK